MQTLGDVIGIGSDCYYLSVYPVRYAQNVTRCGERAAAELWLHHDFDGGPPFTPLKPRPSKAGRSETSFLGPGWISISYSEDITFRRPCKSVQTKDGRLRWLRLLTGLWKTRPDS